MAESGLYLIAACLPSLRPLLTHVDISTVRSRLMGYSNKMFSRFSGRTNTFQSESGGTMRKTNGTKAAGVSFEHLHVNKRQASSEYGHDYLELAHTRGPRS